MKKEPWFKIFMPCFLQYAPSVSLFFVFTGVFSLIFSLYNLETEAVLYAFFLCCLLTAVIFPVRFLFLRKNHKKYLEIQRNLPLFPDRPPCPHTLYEYDMQQILIRFKQQTDDAVSALKNERQEAFDYYTTWVHQIKTPISAMKMILENDDTKEHRELLLELFRIEQYVEMALQYLRLGSESSDYVFKEYDLDLIIKQAIHKFAPQFIAKKIRLHYSPASVRVLTDEKWLLFIIEQILSNSLKYTQTGSISISVSEEKILTIADTGIGIAPEDLPRIFDKGYTGYNGRLYKKSTGLGLYLCRMASDRLSHKISITSSPGAGTSVSLALEKHHLETE